MPAPSRIPEELIGRRRLQVHWDRTCTRRRWCARKKKLLPQCKVSVSATMRAVISLRSSRCARWTCCQAEQSMVTQRAEQPRACIECIDSKGELCSGVGQTVKQQAACARLGTEAAHERRGQGGKMHLEPALVTSTGGRRAVASRGGGCWAGLQLLRALGRGAWRHPKRGCGNPALRGGSRLMLQPRRL